MLRALSLAFRQLGDPRIQKVLGLSLGLAISCFAALFFLAWYAIGAFSGLEGWVGDLTRWLGMLGVLFLAWFTFPIVAATSAALFADRVVEAVMARHYPGRAMPHQVALIETLGDGLKMTGIALVANVFCLFLLVFPPLYALVAYGLNGYLLGREYFEMPAYRRLGRAEARALFQRHRGRFVLAGVVIAFLSTVPFLNLIAPVIGVAFMVHMFESVVNLGPRRA